MSNQIPLSDAELNLLLKIMNSLDNQLTIHLGSDELEMVSVIYKKLNYFKYVKM